LTYTGPTGSGIGTLGIGTVITIKHNDTLNSGTLIFEGSAGQLFTITNNLTSGSIFSVSDSSGIPSIDINADDTVLLAPYNGNVGIGTTNPTSKLFVDGEIRATGNVIAYYSSDIKLKNNIENIKNPIKKLMQINGVEFDWTDEYIQNKGGVDGYFIRKHDIGVIAQEIEKVLPEAVATRNDGEKAVKYELIVPLLIEAIKEQQSEINNLKEKMLQLSEKI
jgi:hypothetical protein